MKTRAGKKSEVVLASQSPARQRLLKRLGVKFLVHPAHLDEEAISRSLKTPLKIVRELSRLKARAVQQKFPQAVLIGSDQVLVAPDGRIFGKPGSPQKAEKQLRACAGREIELLTGLCVRSGNREKVFVHRTKMKFRMLTPKEIRAYVKADRPLDCSGSFKFESFGISLFQSIKTDDPSAIEGLPLLRLGEFLREFEVRFEL